MSLRILGGLTAPALAALIVGASATLGQDTRPALAQTATQTEEAVTIQGFAYAPAALKVKVGTTVRWTNKDAVPHTATARNGAFNTGRIAREGSGVAKLDKVGTFDYFCEIHPQMAASVEVQEDAAPVDLNTVLPPGRQPDPGTGSPPAPSTGGTLPPAPQPGTMLPPGTAQPYPNQVTVEAGDYNFSTAPIVPAGRVSFLLKNVGAEPHHAQAARINDGSTLDQVITAFSSPVPDSAFALLGFYGGPGTVDPQATQEATVELIPGAYLFLCFVQSPDGTPHLAKGMIQPFQVVAEGQGVPMPQAKANVAMRDFSFTLPQFNAGSAVYSLSNEGAQAHELALVKLAPGATALDVFAFFTGPVMGPPPFSSAGGFQAIDKGIGGWVTLEFTPGNYLALCNVPDPASGKSHAELGMVAEFTIP